MHNLMGKIDMDMKWLMPFPTHTTYMRNDISIMHLKKLNKYIHRDVIKFMYSIHVKDSIIMSLQLFFVVVTAT